MRTGFVLEPIFIEHDMGRGHPESPERLISITNMLGQTDMAGRFKKIAARPAKPEELARIHSKRYIERVAQTEGQALVRLDPDTATCAHSYQAALMAAGGSMEAVRAVYEGEVSNAFALVRPPGHHAESSRAMGFCLFNNVAIAAQYARDVLGAGRVMIFDWDLHHGNGTQNSFYDRSDVLYCSWHQFPYYPGSGDFFETGFDEGEGYTVNLPLSYGFEDGDFAEIVKTVLHPIARRYQPDIILVSAGFDIYQNDPLGAMNCTIKGFGILGGLLADIAEEVCQGRMVLFLEGGYHIGGLTEGVRNVLNTMAAGPNGDYGLVPPTTERAKELIKKVISIQKDFWPDLE